MNQFNERSFVYFDPQFGQILFFLIDKLYFLDSFLLKYS